MTVILFDSRVLGTAMTHGRKNARLRRGDAARMLKIPYKTLRKYEQGQQMIPPTNDTRCSFGKITDIWIYIIVCQTY